MPHSLLNELRALEALAMMPFLDNMELAALAALPPSTAADVLRRFHKKGIVEFVKHSRSETSRVRRWCLTRYGVGRLGVLRLKGESVREMILEFSVSAQERRYVLRRLDAASVLYRMAKDAASDHCEPVQWKWSRAGGLDAMMRLPDGRSAGLSRIGSTHSGGAIKDRLNTLTKMYARKVRCPTFLLVPGPVELQRALNWFKGRRLPVFVAVEDEVMQSSPGSATWYETASGAFPLSLAHCLQRTPPSDLPNTRQPSTRRLTLQGDSLDDDTEDLDRTACELTIPARRMIRILFDWPFIRVSQLQKLLCVSAGHLRREKALLSRLGLMHHLRIGSTPEQRYYNETRLCLSRQGLTYLSRLDRSLLIDRSLRRRKKKPSGLLDHWLVEPAPDGSGEPEIAGFFVRGSKAATLLLNEIHHTDGIYRFVELLADGCDGKLGWRIDTLLPAHRWERRFRQGARAHSVHKDIWRAFKPDATMILKRGDKQIPLFLELERRATQPSTMAAKLQPLRNYYASGDTGGDFAAGRPHTLVVFERREYASRFASHAAYDRGPEIPLLVSSLQQLEASGVFGKSWTVPWDEGYVSLDRLP